MKHAVMAAFRPAKNDIAVFVRDGGHKASVVLEIDEARAIYGALGLALRLADCREQPLKAVDGGRE